MLVQLTYNITFPFKTKNKSNKVKYLNAFT